MQLPARYSSSRHSGLLFLRVQDANGSSQKGWEIMVAHQVVDEDPDRQRWISRVDREDVYKCTVEDCRQGCGHDSSQHTNHVWIADSLKKVSRINLEGTTSIAQSKSELWRTKKR